MYLVCYPIFKSEPVWAGICSSPWGPRSVHQKRLSTNRETDSERDVSPTTHLPDPPPKNNWLSRLSAYPCSNTGDPDRLLPHTRNLKTQKSKCFFQQRNSSHRHIIREVKCPVILPGQRTMTMKKKMGEWWIVFSAFVARSFSCWTYSEINYAKLITSLIW